MNRWRRQREVSPTAPNTRRLAFLSASTRTPNDDDRHHTRTAEFNNDSNPGRRLISTATASLHPSAPESAIIFLLHPGPYTAIVSGAGNTTGNVTLEVFELD